mmetsp:Transcript_2836/g.12790  ORF Transcript_2836/g.12790 Transcript_2836/m.12790 type:complete len:220 (-) Transcript_2836:431-1090(-)
MRNFRICERDSTTGASGIFRTTSSSRPCWARARWARTRTTRRRSRPSCCVTTSPRWSDSWRLSRRNWRRRRSRRRRRNSRLTAVSLGLAVDAEAAAPTPGPTATKTSTRRTGTTRTRSSRGAGATDRAPNCAISIRNSKPSPPGTTRTRSVSSTRTTRGSSGTPSWTGSGTSWRSSGGITRTGRRTRPRRTYWRTERTDWINRTMAAIYPQTTRTGTTT